MNTIENDFDVKMVSLESEWRQVYELSIAARAKYQRLSASTRPSVDALDSAQEELDRAEALKARILAKIDRLEIRFLGRP